MVNIKTLQAYVALCCLLVLCVILLFWWSLFSWSVVDISATDAFSAIFKTDDSSIAHTVIREIRIPRALVAITVGCALATAGAIIQGLTSNPLASPSVLGINSGAALGMALVSTVDAWHGVLGTSVAAVLGSAIVWVIVMALGGTQSSKTGSRLILAGIAMSALCMALTKALVILNENQAVAVLSWLAGGFVESRWPTWNLLWPVIIPSLLLAFVLAPALNLLQLGNDNAQSLGLVIWLTRLVASLLVLVLVGWSISFVGAIGFVGLIVPHIARKLCGHDHRRFMPVSMLLGASLVLLADTLSRAIAFPGEIPAGAILALFGTPIFIYLVRNRT